MKRLLLLGVGSALMFTMGGVGPAMADNGPHQSGAAATSGGLQYVSNAAGKCAACHRAHTAQNEFLLVQAQPALCYSCHDGTGIASTNVKSGQDFSGKALRGGGFVTAAIDAGNANSTWVGGSRTLATVPTLKTPVPVTSRHQIGTSGTAWGNGTTETGGLGATITLECTSCHDPHGNGNYRILKSVPDGAGAVKAAKAVTVAITGVADNPATPLVNEYVKAVPLSDAVVAVVIPPVVIPDADAKKYTTDNYWLTGDSNVPIGTSTAFTGAPKVAGVGGATTSDLPADGYIQNIAAWCTTCHTRYLAPTQSYKTASGDPKFMYRHRSDANYKQGAANCITCHVSHGSNAGMDNANSGSADAVLDPAGNTPSVTLNSRLLRVNNRGTCEMCHNV